MVQKLENIKFGNGLYFGQNVKGIVPKFSTSVTHSPNTNCPVQMIISILVRAVTLIYIFRRNSFSCKFIKPIFLLHFRTPVCRYKPIYYIFKQFI